MKLRSKWEREKRKPCADRGIVLWLDHYTVFESVSRNLPRDASLSRICPPNQIVGISLYDSASPDFVRSILLIKPKRNLFKMRYHVVNYRFLLSAIYHCSVWFVIVSILFFFLFFSSIRLQNIIIILISIFSSSSLLLCVLGYAYRECASVLNSQKNY